MKSKRFEGCRVSNPAVYEAIIPRFVTWLRRHGLFERFKANVHDYHGVWLREYFACVPGLALERLNKSDTVLPCWAACENLLVAGFEYAATPEGESFWKTAESAWCLDLDRQLRAVYRNLGL